MRFLFVLYLINSYLSIFFILSRKSKSVKNDGLVAYFPFNGSVKDVINDNDGITFGGFYTFDRNGNENMALFFDDNRIDYPNISAYNQEEVSIAFWF